MSTKSETAPQKKTLIEKGFELGNGIDKALIAAGLGVVAIGSVILAPAAVAFGGTLVAGSVAGIAITNRIRDGYEKRKTRRTASAAPLGKKVTRDHFRLAA